MIVREAQLSTVLGPVPGQTPLARSGRFAFHARFVDAAARVAAPATIARVSLALVYLWFGALKVVGTSPAAELVAALQRVTLPFLHTGGFLVGLGLYEMAVGSLLLLPKGRRIGLVLLFLHMPTTFLPLVVLPEITWHGFPALTLAGQYIVKNVVIVALAFSLIGRDH
jgi:uncharacterized membrane protein YkgB